LKFTEYENVNNKDGYRNFDGFPKCSNAFNPKFRWQSTDSKYGQDFMVWYQNETKVANKEECKEM